MPNPFDDDKVRGKNPLAELFNPEELNKPNNTEHTKENKQPIIEPKPEPKQEKLFESPNSTNDRDERIKQHIANMQFPSQILIRPIYDYKNPVHITCTMGAEMVEITKYEPPNSFLGNLAFDMLKLFHELRPDFKDKLEHAANIIMRIPKADDRQDYLSNLVKDMFLEMVKDEYK